MDYESKKTHEIALGLVKGIGPQVYRLLMQEFEEVEDIFNLSAKELKSFITNDKISKSILEKSTFYTAEKQFKFCEKRGIEILFFKDKKYPARLNFYEGTPCVLYYQGNADLNVQKVVSIVGTRAPSHQGKVRVEKIVEELKKHDCLIVSGLAFGIDVLAHSTSLNLGLKTIGVTAHGHDLIYPDSNADIAKKMLTQGGLLSEYMAGTEMIRELFPSRNRIVAAMCDAVIVVESAKKGGSLITADFGNEYGKDVFAVPGRPDDEASQGCNWLIKSHRAHMYESILDMEYIMRWNKEKTVVQAKLFEDLTEDEKIIIQLIRQHGEMHIDSLSQHFKGTIAGVLLEMELKGIIKSIPGKRYISA